MENRAWPTLEGLISSDRNQREMALEELGMFPDVQDQPLVVYLLATRLFDPDIQLRFQAVQMLGNLLAADSTGRRMPERSLKVLAEYTSQMEKGQLIKLLEVSVNYLAAEESILEILKLCSYAGKAMGGILNDRRLPVMIRQQAIYFCGEVGFLVTMTAIENLIQRIEKDRNRTGLAASRKKLRDQETLYPYAVAALGKLEGL